MLNKIRKLKNKKGFTLVELIVVIAIIAVLTAVIVPLIGRYSTQAAYITLQDAAKTISDNLKTVMPSVSMEGTPANCMTITGSKSGGTLSVDVDGADGTGTSVNDSIAEKARQSLESTLAEGAHFCAETRGGAVVGVVYSTNQDVTGFFSGNGSGTAASTWAANTSNVSVVPDFKNAYANSAGALGVAGACIPHS